MSDTEEFLFYPTKRISATRSVYDDELKDFLRCMAQQPLEFLPRHLCPRFHKGLRPPKLWYGWRVGKKHLMDIVEKHFSHCIHRVPDDEYEQSPTEEGDGLIIDVNYTLESDQLLEQICKHIGIPYGDDLFDIMPLFNEKAKLDMGVVYSCNYRTRADAANALKVANFFADGQLGKWYLDHTEWKWANVDVPTKSSASAKKKPRRAA